MYKYHRDYTFMFFTYMISLVIFVQKALVV